MSDYLPVLKDSNEIQTQKDWSRWDLFHLFIFNLFKFLFIQLILFMKQKSIYSKILNKKNLISFVTEGKDNTKYTRRAERIKSLIFYVSSSCLRTAGNPNQPQL